MTSTIENKQELAQIIRRSQSQTTFDVAQVVFKMYEGQYKCASIQNNTWYCLVDGRWKSTDSGISLMKKISNEVLNEYLKMISHYNQIAYDNDDDVRDQACECAKNLTDVTYKLRDLHFRQDILGELCILFYDEYFIPSL